MNHRDPQPPPDFASEEHPQAFFIVNTIIVVVFVCLVVLFLWGPTTLDSAATAVLNTNSDEFANIPATQVVIQPVRERAINLTTYQNPDGSESITPRIRMSGFDRSCQECHGMFSSRPETVGQLVQHTHVRLDHGLNDRCFNCHDLEDRDRLVLHDGQTVNMQNVEMLCAKCHGPTFRDWEKGIHGRVDGYWNADMGTPVKRRCTECHDPHAPAFGQMALLDGPHSLRMQHTTDSSKPVHHETDENPLRRWMHTNATQHDDGDSVEEETDSHNEGNH